MSCLPGGLHTIGGSEIFSVDQPGLLRHVFKPTHTSRPKEGQAEQRRTLIKNWRAAGVLTTRDSNDMVVNGDDSPQTCRG